MREILFRGKSKESGEWLFGNYTFFDSPEKSHWIFQNGFSTMNEIIPETVGQFTGLVDMHGRKIFEGDIVKEADVIHEGEVQIAGRKFIATMSNGCWVAENTACGITTYKWLKTAALEGASVIGNVYDNPGLMEGSLNE